MLEAKSCGACKAARRRNPGFVPSLDSRQPPRRPTGRAPTPAAPIGGPLFRAFFDADRDTSDARVLRDAAAEAGLDLAPFDPALGDPALREEVLAAHVAAVDEFGVEAVPTTIIGRRRPRGRLPPALEAQLAEEPRVPGEGERP